MVYYKFDITSQYSTDLGPYKKIKLLITRRRDIYWAVKLGS